MKGHEWGLADDREDGTYYYTENGNGTWTKDIKEAKGYAYLDDLKDKKIELKQSFPNIRTVDPNKPV